MPSCRTIIALQAAFMVICLCMLSPVAGQDDPAIDPSLGEIVVPGPVISGPVEPIHPHDFHAAPPYAYHQHHRRAVHEFRHYLDPCCYGILAPGYLKHRWHHHLKPWMHATHWGYEEYFIPEPLGGSVHSHMQAQISRGWAAQLALYHFDFHEGPVEQAARLNDYGLARLRSMMQLLTCSQFPLVIERTSGDPELDEARRVHVINEIAAMSSVPIDAQRVIVGEPTPLGMRGNEAFENYLNQLEQTRRRGLFLPSTGAGSGSFRPTPGFTPGAVR